MKKRILLLLHELTITGAPKAMLDAFRAFDGKYEIRIVCEHGGRLQTEFASLGQVCVWFETPNTADLRNKVMFFLRARMLWSRIRRHVKRFRPDLIYINSVASLSLAARLSLPPTPTLLHVHELDSLLDLYVPSSHDEFIRVNRYVAVSEAVRQSLINNYQVAPNAIGVVYASIPDGQTDGPSPLAHTNGPFVVGGAGSPQWRKGIDLWLEVAVEVASQLGEDNVRFHWVGVQDDQEGRIFRFMARKRKIDHLVKFIPATTEPLRHFDEFDIFAMTSWEDPCPRVVLESMLLERPAVCFADGGGAAELVGRTGIVIEDFSAKRMAEEVLALAQDPERRRTLGQAARQRVLHNYLNSIQLPKLRNEMERLFGAAERIGEQK